MGNQIYSHLYTLAQSNKNNADAQNFHITIAASKDKIATVKDSAGKILEYRINLNSNIVVKNYLTKDEILTQNFISFSTYKVQNEYSETVKLENKTIENLINKTYQDLLINLSENITAE